MARAEADVEARASRIWTGHIPADNVGFRLLRKAGWSVGAGLGAVEQGRREPIQPELPKGTRGIGFDTRAAQLAQQRDPHGPGRKRSAEEAAGGPGAEQQRQQPEGARRRRAGADRVAALVEEELGRESLGDKVARHRQLMRRVARGKGGWAGRLRAGWLRAAVPGRGMEWAGRRARAGMGWDGMGALGLGWLGVGSAGAGAEYVAVALAMAAGAPWRWGAVNRGTEHQQARGRAIERYLRAAFNDPFDHLLSDNSNPLSRRHKLTESNPLLDPLGD
ncbi:hypothetical protein GPECTOR_34g810 [Gonium pectorale]|uniref:G-patch domain-containing protein n=1 Tax=Gonium pectorale TaxID=33097 RepID=A0A150GCS3_GONPE|nr:hypothetical protein GPECTOR_34g810 [Gonium pectorale]|eukprot:KXZ47651.1 hypothetical protein GPECTOR_34g810 [Gonium pectorale]